VCARVRACERAARARVHGLVRGRARAVCLWVANFICLWNYGSRGHPPRDAAAAADLI